MIHNPYSLNHEAAGECVHHLVLIGSSLLLETPMGIVGPNCAPDRWIFKWFILTKAQSLEDGIRSL
jgi:hypothetical protein